MSDNEHIPAVHEISGTTYVKYHGTDAHVTIPDEITVIGDSAFAGCTFLKSVTLPHGITVIEPSAFEGCYRLREIDLPDSVTAIRFAAFEGCASLERIALPEGITAIEKWTFKDCAALTSISLPSSLKELSSSAFRDCCELRDISLPEGLLSIGETAFRGCTALTDLVIPDSVKTIGKLAFRDCTHLEHVSIHERTVLSEDAFSRCPLLHLEKRSDAPKLKAPPKQTPPRRKAIVDDWLIIDGVLCSYSGTDAHVEIPHGVTSISGFAFRDRSTIASITVPETVTELDDHCFTGCDNLTEAIVTEGSAAHDYFTKLGIPCRFTDSAPAAPAPAEQEDHGIDDLRLDIADTQRLRKEAEEAEHRQREAEAEAERLRLEAEEAERLRKEAEEAAKRPADPMEAERLRREAEQQQFEAEQARQKRKEAAARRKQYDKLYDEIARQDYIIATNSGLFGQSARNRKDAEKRRAALQAQLKREFPNGRPKS